MKKIFLTIACIVLCMVKTQAQNSRNDTILTIEQIHSSVGYQVHVCSNKYNRAIVYAPEGCNDFVWAIGDEAIYNVSPVIFNSNSGNHQGGYFYGCGYDFGFSIYFDETNVPNETTEEIWIHSGELAELSAVGSDSASMYSIRWNTGEDENVIHKPAGTYIAGISDMCATAYRTKVVKETPELTASCDLASGYNMLEWETSAQQATYIVSLNIYFDYDPNCLYSELVANVDYNAGSYIDTGHDSWQSPCQYHAVPVMANGEEAPLRSYWVRTISLSDLMASQGLQMLQWTPYTTEDDSKNGRNVLAYQIFDVVDGEASYRATVGSFANTYNYDPTNFNGFAAVAAVLDGAKDGELLAYSRTQHMIGDPDGTPENQSPIFAIYPNPATGVINIQAMEQGNHNLTIYNMMGQVIYSGVINGGVFTSPRLTPGTYTVVCDGGTQRVVVE